MLRTVPWLAVGSLASGVTALWFIRYLWPYRNKLGGWYFILTIACEALWSLSYGTALFVFDPQLRWLFEIPIWLSINFIGVFFMAFALEYTGRGNFIRTTVFRAIVGVQVLHTLVVVTNPLHHIAWSNYHIEPTWGLATVAYTHQPWLFINATGFILLIGVGSFLLSDTVFSYGPLYRTQAAAIALSPIFPGVPFLLWLAQIGPSPPLNLTPLVFPIHLAFDMYAFFSRNMFEMVPAARRVAERAAIDDLGSPVVIVDTGDRVIEFNTEASRVFGVSRAEALGTPIADLVDKGDPREADGGVSMRVDGRPREYAVTESSLSDHSGDRVGDTLVLQDVTAERQREQRLAVLNRVLRHNLRNDLNVVHGFVDVAQEQVEDEGVAEQLAVAERKTAAVMSLGEKARDIERAIESGVEAASATPVAATVRAVVEDLSEQYPDASLRLAEEGTATVQADELLLDRVIRNLVENALEHAGEDPRVAVAVRTEGDPADAVVIEVADDGPGIPEHELTVLGRDETDLEHGSGLGLWLVRWGVDTLGGTLSFDTDGGTTVTLRFPVAGRED